MAWGDHELGGSHRSIPPGPRNNRFLVQQVSMKEEVTDKVLLTKRLAEW